MCVLYVKSVSKVRPITFGCVAICSSVLFILRSRLLLHFHRVWSEQSVSCFVWIYCGVLCFVQEKLYVGMIVCVSLLHSWLCV